MPYSIIYKTKKRFNNLNPGWTKSNTDIYNVLDLYD